MTRNADKKSKEEALMNRVKLLYQDFPIGTLTSVEEPDFLVVGEGRTVGLELTEYIRGQCSDHGSPLRTQEAIRERIMARAECLFTEKSDAVLDVYAYWHPAPKKPLKQVDVERIATEIARLVFERISANPSSPGTIDPWEEQDFPIIEPYITMLTFHPLPQPRWSSGTSGFLATSPDDIQCIITKKDKRAATYRQKCAEVWLVIVSDGSSLSSMLVLDETTASYQFNSAFDRVLLCDLPRNNILTLNIAPPT